MASHRFAAWLALGIEQTIRAAAGRNRMHASAPLTVGFLNTRNPYSHAANVRLNGAAAVDLSRPGLVRAVEALLAPHAQTAQAVLTVPVQRSRAAALALRVVRAP